MKTKVTGVIPRSGGVTNPMDTPFSDPSPRKETASYPSLLTLLPDQYDLSLRVLSVSVFFLCSLLV